jgi:hypothetical protein
MAVSDLDGLAGFEHFEIGAFAVGQLAGSVLMMQDLEAGPADDVLARIALHHEESVVYHRDAAAVFDDHDRVAETVYKILTVPVTFHAITSAFTAKSRIIAILFVLVLADAQVNNY